MPHGGGRHRISFCVLSAALGRPSTFTKCLCGAHVVAWIGSGELVMKVDPKLRTPLMMIVGALIVLGSAGALSYREYRACVGRTNSCDEIDPLAGDPASQWSVYGGLSSDEVSITRSAPDSIELSIHPTDPAQLDTDWGLSYTAGLFEPGWYEFTAELESSDGNQAAPNNQGAPEDQGGPANPGAGENEGAPENQGVEENQGAPNNPGAGDHEGVPDNPGAGDNQDAPEDQSVQDLHGIQIELYSDNWRFASKGQHSNSGDWRRIETYFRPADYNPVLAISCRFLGKPGKPPIVASLRNMRIVRLEGPPPANRAHFDIQKKQQQRLRVRFGRRRKSSPLSMPLVVIVPSIVALACWRQLA